MSKIDYITSLSRDERILFLKMIIKMIGIDGKIAPEEREFVQQLIKDYQLPKSAWSEIQNKVTEEELLEIVKNTLNHTQILFLMKELLTVANSDCELDDRELDFIVRVGGALELDDDKITDINQLVLDQRYLDARAAEVLEVEYLQ